MKELRASGGIWNSIFGGNDGINLKSRTYLNVIFALSNGEIAGFPSGDDIRKFLYVNDTPVIAPDGTENIKGVTAEWRSGTQFQDPFNFTNGIGSNTPVGVKVSKSIGPVTRTIQGGDIDSIRVTVSTPGIGRVDDEGFNKSSRVDFKIYLSVNSGAFVEKFSSSFEGRSSGGYSRDFEINTEGLLQPFQVRIERLSDDIPPSNTKEQNDIYWQAYTTFTREKLRYPNTALLWVRVDSAQFTAQPNFTVKLNGLICDIPSSYNPVTRTYSGLWDGTFTRGFTNNPAWCLGALQTNSIFGLGRKITWDKLDKWSLYAIARYCDELVDNGLGGTEPRFTYNAYLDTAEDAQSLLQSLLSQIRGVVFYAGGQIMFGQDRPGIDPQDIFTDANVVTKYSDDGELEQPPFTYDYVSLKEKHAIAHVAWYDPNEYSKRKTAYIDLYDIGYGDDFNRYGDEVLNIDLPGCTSESEAVRHGRWALISERTESKTITFASGSQAAIRLPGELIRVSDSHELGGRFGGRIVAVDGNTVIVDSPVDATGQLEFLTVVEGIEVSKAIASINGTSITLSETFTTNPEPNSPWVISGGEIQPETYRLIAVSDADDGSYGLMGILHNPAKWIVADSIRDITVNTRDRSIPDPPSNLTIQSMRSGYFLGWEKSPSKNAIGYAVEWEEGFSGRWTPAPISSGDTDLDIVLPSGSYRFRVAAINIYGRRSNWLYSSTAYGTSGTIESHFDDGSVKLDKEVIIEDGKSYILRTNCENPAGQRPVDLPFPYSDERAITNSPGVTNRIYTTPSYLGNTLTLTPGTYNTLPTLNDDVSFISVTGGNVTIYQDVNLSGLSKVLVPGIYRADKGQLAPIPNDSISSVLVSAGATVFLSQHEPGRNPIPASTWFLVEV